MCDPVVIEAGDTEVEFRQKGAAFIDSQITEFAAECRAAGFSAAKIEAAMPHWRAKAKEALLSPNVWAEISLLRDHTGTEH